MLFAPVMVVFFDDVVAEAVLDFLIFLVFFLMLGRWMWALLSRTSSSGVDSKRGSFSLLSRRDTLVMRSLATLVASLSSKPLPEEAYPS